MTNISGYTFEEHYAESQMFRSIYTGLLRVANSQLRREPLGYLWSPAALVNEAYIRVVDVYGKAWIERGNLIALWRRVMRNVLIDHARNYRTEKRNGGRFEPVTPDLHSADPSDLELAIGFSRAMERLHDADRRQAMVIRLRFCEGLSLDETAEALQVSLRTVKRALRAARGQLQASLS